MTEEAKVPLQKLAEQLFGKLTELHYNKRYIQSFKLIYNKLLSYSAGVNTVYMTDELQTAFLHDVYGNASKSLQKYAFRYTEMLLSLQESGEIVYKRNVETTFPDGLAEIYEGYLNLCRLRVREKSLKTYRSILKVSAKYLSENGVDDIAKVNRDIIVNFTIALSRFKGQLANRTLKLFSEVLEYAHEQGFCEENLSKYCMKVRFFKSEKIPPTYTKDEIERILSVIDRDTKIGKRDYAMILLASRTGLRGCDIINLKLSNLRFDTDTIEISQKKTSKLLVLPMTEEIGCICYNENAEKFQHQNVGIYTFLL